MEATKCKAVVVQRYGGYESLVIQDSELPPLDCNVEVKVEYGGINFADIYRRQGLVMDVKTPFVLGMECTGTITAIGSKLFDTDLKVGQRVICYDYKGGMYREVLRISPSKCFPLPDHISTKNGAAIFVNYLTAFFSLIHLGGLRKDHSVLILSCAGGVGSAATQIAKTIAGVEVYGTGSNFKEMEARINGVDVFIPNNKLGDLNKYQYDLILANQVGSTFPQLQDMLKPLGRIVIIGANNMIHNEQRISLYTHVKMWFSNKTVPIGPLITKNQAVGGLHLGTLLENNRVAVEEALQRIFSLMKDNVLKPSIYCTKPMSQIVSATRLLAERKNIGKVLIKISNE